MRRREFIALLGTGAARSGTILLALWLAPIANVRANDPPKRIGASEWPSAEQAQAYLKSPQRAALDSDRAKAFKTTRQFIVERPN